ncbi:MAG: hypothetical protein AAGD92_06225 [Pseudomonadota bacterium]
MDAFNSALELAYVLSPVASALAAGYFGVQYLSASPSAYFVLVPLNLVLFTVGVATDIFLAPSEIGGLAMRRAMSTPWIFFLVNLGLLSAYEYFKEYFR